jgi:cyclohexadienyl dehydratase
MQENNKTNLNSQVAIIISILAIAFSSFPFFQKSVAPAPLLTVENTNTLEQIKKTKNLTVCYGQSNPTSYKDASTGIVKGHDIEILKEIFAPINPKTEYLEQSFGNFAAALDSNKCQVAVSYVINPERASGILFSNPVFSIGLSGLTKKGAKTFSSLSEIDQPGVRVVTSMGEAGDNWAKKNLKNATVTPISSDNNDQTRFLLEIEAGRADIAIADSNTIANFAKTHPETVDSFVGKSFGVTSVAFAFKNGSISYDLKYFVDASMDALEQEGKIKQILDSYSTNWLRLKREYK